MSSQWPLSIMVYGAGEAVDGNGALAPQIEAQLSRLTQIITNSRVAGTAQLDSSNLPAQRYVLDPAGRQSISQFPNVDVGDPNELVKFVAWSSSTCPAQRSVLVLSGHGASWEDGMVDQVLGLSGTVSTRTINVPPPVSGAIHHARSIFGNDVSPTGSLTRAILIDGQDRDYLSNAELGAACAQISSTLGRKLDVLVFDACLMSSWEVLQELSDSVAVVVASIDELSAAGIDMSAPATDLSLSLSPGDAVSIGAAIVRRFTPQASFDTCVAVDLTNAGWVTALTAFREFCTTFLAWLRLGSQNIAAALNALRIASSSVVEFNTGGLADLNALANAVGDIPNLPSETADQLRTAASSLASCVIARVVGSDYGNAMGLSVFSPGSLAVYNTNRPDYLRLQLPNLTGWAAILDTIYGLEGNQARLLGGNATTAPQSTGDQDAEFAIELRGIPIDSLTLDRIERAIKRAVLEKLAEVDLLGDVTVTPLSAALNTVRLINPAGQGTAGLMISPNRI
jgi:hypothetical protein